MEGGTTLNNPFQNNNNEVGDGMQCIHHPHRTNPSGICAFCLQEKLGKLVSSSVPLPPLASSSSTTCSSPSPSSPPITSSSLQTNHHQRLPNNKPNTCTSSTNIIFKRSKSTATPKRNPNHHHNDFSPRKRNGFWSFLYPSSKHSVSKPRDKSCTSSKKTDHVIITTTEEENNNNNKCMVSSSLVSRSRSVGCGSRSFSGDFFERISSGLGDCTLRRVESQREGKPNLPGSVNINRCMKERVRCGGIFGGFVMTSSSSSSSCSWVSSSAEERKSWGWTFASPIRAFGTKGSSSKRNDSSHKNATPNLSAIPSLLAVRG